MKEEMKKNIELVERKLDEFIPISYPEKIFESMRYSVLAGGKRLRPIMCLEACKVFGGNIEDALATACAIEMLHTQSLIHDDLPCMDNDDYRRGKLTNHKAFDEATAILAGDALLSFAPQLIIQKTPQNISDNIKLKILNEFFNAAGVFGIIGGQIVDINSENKKIDEQTLKYLHLHKTSALFDLSVTTGALIAGVDKNIINEMKNFAYHFGLAFQICDDILDEIATFEELGKTPKKDEKSKKSTYTTIYGLEKAKEFLSSHVLQACDIIEKNNFNSKLFIGITK